MTPTSIAGYLALFTFLGAGFLMANLVVGKFVRPANPHKEKLEIYECGEPTIGSSFVQFDLRFYVVALLFIVFDVEVAFFFPWAAVFGKATHVMDPNLAATAAADPTNLNPAFGRIHRQMGIPEKSLAVPATGLGAKVDPPVQAAALRKTASQLARFSLWDMGVFFAVLMTGFAYVWKRGDLDWVRAVSHERRQPGPRLHAPEPALSA